MKATSGKRPRAPGVRRPGRSQIELRTAEERWSLIENPIFGVTMLDERHRFITSNRTFRAMTGYSRSELRQLTPLDISIPGEREFNKMLFRELQEDKRQHFEMIKRLRRKDGKLIWIHLYVFAIASPETGAKRTFGINFDITEMKQAQDAVQKARADMAHVARVSEMAAMTGSIAHEIGQPLAAISAQANAGLRWLAHDNPNIAEARASLQSIARDSQRAAEIVKSIRAIFKPDGRQRAALNVNASIREALALARGDLDKQQIVVETELASDLPAVNADPVQLQQVMFNLISNAIDAMQSLTDRDRVLRVKSEADGDGVLITVEDSGPGIPAENIDKVFDTFFTTKLNGMGMGLAICRSIVAAYGGSLTAVPGRRRGAVFKLALPAGDVASEPDPKQVQADKERARATAARIASVSKVQRAG